MSTPTIYISNKMNQKHAKLVGKLYRQAVYNKNVTGKYHLAEISKGVIPEGLDEEKIINDFLDAVKGLKDYPSNQAGVYYRLVNSKCIEGDSKKEIDQLMYDALLSESMVYRRLREAYSIIGEVMAKKGSFGGFKNV